MSYKFGLLLSLVFVALFTFLSADIISIQNLYSLLDSKSINISYYLARNGDLSEESISYIENKYNVDFTLLSSPNPSFGDDIVYQISTMYNPFVMGEEMNIVIQRMTVVGYFN